MSKTHPNFFARMRSFAAAKPLLAIAIVGSVGLAAAAITITYTTSSTVTTTVTEAPVQFVAGDDSTLAPYVSGYSISTNKTYFAATVKGIPEATVTIGDLVKIANVDSVSHVVTLSTTQVSNAKVSAYVIDVHDANGVRQQTMTLTAASPSVAFTLPAGQTWSAKLTLTLLSGAGADNVALTNSLTLGVA